MLEGKAQPLKAYNTYLPPIGYYYVPAPPFPFLHYDPPTSRPIGYSSSTSGLLDTHPPIPPYHIQLHKTNQIHPDPLHSSTNTQTFKPSTPTPQNKSCIPLTSNQISISNIKKDASRPDLERTRNETEI